MQEVVFDGLDVVQDVIRRRARDTAYVTIRDSTQRNNEDALGRFDFDAETLARHSPLQLAGDEDLAERCADACADWLEQLAVRHLAGDAFRRFRVDLYGPKGMYRLDSGRFLAKDVAQELADALPLAVPAPGPEEADPMVGRLERALQAIAHGYQVLLAEVQGNLAKMGDMTLRQLARADERHAHDVEQIDRLVAAHLQVRAESFGMEQHIELVRGRERRLDRSVSEAFGVVQQAVTAYLHGQGMAPELATVANELGRDPKLLATLARPEVVELLRQPENRELLIQLLESSAAQHRQAADTPEQAASAS